MAASGIETEIKLRAASPDEARARLIAASFVETKPRSFESNVLLDDAAGSLRQASQVLRVRECAGEAILTYKGPPALGRHKSREELETQAADAVALLAVLARLGFAPTYRYEKYRTEFARTGEPGVATLDETPIGNFYELEGDAAWIDRAAAELGFAEADYLTDSYGSLYRQYCEKQLREPGAGMLFPR